MKLWVDDLRPAPNDTWVSVTSSDDAILYLALGDYDTMSLDHDLGGEDTTRRIVMWLIESEPQCWPDIVIVHTANPVGRDWLLGMISRYAPHDVKIMLSRR